MGCSCGSMLCWKRNRARGPCNEIRVLELILCLVSFGLSFYFTSTGILPVPIFLTLFCMVGIIFILIVDIIVITAWFPIGWRAWILISVSSSLYFFTCTGLSFLMVHKYYYVGSAVYFVTAIIFLMDGLCIVWLVRRTEDTISRTCPSSCKSGQIVPVNKPIPVETRQSSKYTAYSDNTQQTIPPAASSRVLEPPKGGRRAGTGVVYSAGRIARGTYCNRMPSSVVFSNRSVHNVDKANTSTAYITDINKPMVNSCTRQVPVVTHGGTFHVSKDVVPMPSAEPNLNLTKSISEPEIVDTIDIEEADTKDLRSVSVMIKTLPRKTQEVDLTPLRSPFADDSPRTPPKQKMADRVKSVQCLLCKPCRKSCTTFKPSRHHQIKERAPISPTTSQHLHK